MTAGTHEHRILQLLIERPGLDDDQVAQALGIQPRQTVNQICRRLEVKGVLRRDRGAGGKICNFVAGGAPVSPAKPLDRRPAPQPGPRLDQSLAPGDLAKTLLIIPCSGAKRDHADIGRSGPGIAQCLPHELARELLEARSRVKESVRFDESAPVPAWQRYDGALYKEGREAIGGFIEAGAHVVIMSGGYGTVLATEPIGRYNARLALSSWPGRIIERVLLGYAERHGIVSVRAIVSATTAYRAILKRVQWKEAGVSDAVLISPCPEKGALKRSPAAQGEALAALYDGKLSANWESGSGLGISVQAV